MMSEKRNLCDNPKALGVEERKKDSDRIDQEFKKMKKLVLIVWVG